MTVDRKLLYRTPRPYQDDAIDFLCYNVFAGLFIDMGLGKTMIILHAILELPRPVLLVGPIRVIETVWEQEAREWAATRNLRFSLLRGSPAERRAAAEVEADVYLVNPELLEEALTLRDDYQVLVIDESSQFKNPSTKRFKRLRKHLKRFKHRIIATGTPAPNSLLDLWSQIFILDQGKRLDTAFGRFQRKFFYTVDWQGYKWEAHDWAQDEITKIVSDLVFEMSLEDAGIGLKEPVNNIVPVRLPAKARKIYDDMEKRAFANLGKGQELTAAMAATKTMKLRQLASGFVYDDEGNVSQVHDAKIQALQEIVEGTGSPIIVVYQFQHELKALQKAFPQGVTFGKRGPGWDKLARLAEHQRDAWNAGKIPIMFLHPQSGGHGLNLQFGGHVMAIFTASFSLEQMDQIRRRIQRSGQQKTVIYHWLVAEGTVDNILLEVLQGRAANQKGVLRLIKEYANAKNNHRRGTGRGGEVDPGPVPGKGVGAPGPAHRRPRYVPRRPRGSA